MKDLKAKEVGATLVAQYNLIETLREENARLLAAVVEMKKMLPVLVFIDNLCHDKWQEATRGTGIATLNAYRLALETALAKRSEP